MTRAVYAIATMDTKGEEIAYVAERLRSAGATVRVIDVGTAGPPVGRPDVAREIVAAASDEEAAAILSHTDRGAAVTAMSRALVAYLVREERAGHVAGVIGLGGSGGTALITPALQALPIGLPKLMVSTVASGNTAPYVGCSDITLMYSVVDVAGLNAVSRQVLGNAAHAMAGMVAQVVPKLKARSTLGMTMFGVTTPCVDAVRKSFEAEGYDCLVFHATGAGGRAMEKLVESGFIDGVLDITTTEIADEVVGGVFAAGPGRMDAILAKGVPYVLSLGALDMVNFGAKETVPPDFQKRLLHVHNAQVTLMRTSPDENRQFARWIAEKLNRSSAPVRVLIPEGGVSLLDAPGQAFYDTEADAALFEELESRVHQSSTRQIRRLPLHINDPRFSQALVEAYYEVSGSHATSG